MSTVMLPNDKSTQKYIVNDQCTKCGVCVQVCPVRNIMVDKKIDFDNHCEGCFSCLHLCPKNALHLKNEQSGMCWRNPDVSLNEII